MRTGPRRGNSYHPGPRSHIEHVLAGGDSRESHEPAGHWCREHGGGSERGPNLSLSFLELRKWIGLIHVAPSRSGGGRAFCSVSEILPGDRPRSRYDREVIWLCFQQRRRLQSNRARKLKSEIAAKIDAKGVRNYRLEIIATADVKDQNVGGLSGRESAIECKTFGREQTLAVE